MSIMDTGFKSKQQEDYIRLNHPSLYLLVIKKWGNYTEYKKPTPPKRPSSININRGVRK